MEPVDFTSFDVKQIEVKDPNPNKHGGKSCFVDVKGTRGQVLFKSPASRVTWEIKPGVPDLRPDERLNMEIDVDDDAFKKSLETLDNSLLDQIFKKKIEIFGASAANKMSSIDALRVKYKEAGRKGAAKKNGEGFYKDTMRLKVDGWTPDITEVVFREYTDAKSGLTSKIIDKCIFKPRIYSNPAENDTHFFLFGGKDDKGQDKWFSKVPVVDENNSFKRDDKGAPVFRCVGPQDCTQNSEVTVHFAIQKIYVSDGSCGPTIAARKVFIKPAAQKSSRTVVNDGYVVEAPSAEDAMRALQGDFAGGAEAAGSPGGGTCGGADDEFEGNPLKRAKTSHPSTLNEEF